MDNKQLLNILSQRTGRPVGEVKSLVDALAGIVRRAAADLDAVAVPTFGTFTPVKHPEEVRRDLSTGKNILLPPEITLTFKPGSLLLKRLRHE